MSQYLKATRTRCGYKAWISCEHQGELRGTFTIPNKRRRQGTSGTAVGARWNAATGALILCGLTCTREPGDVEPLPYDLVLE